MEGNSWHEIYLYIKKAFPKLRVTIKRLQRDLKRQTYQKCVNFKGIKNTSETLSNHRQTTTFCQNYFSHICEQNSSILVSMIGFINILITELQNYRFGNLRITSILFKTEFLHLSINQINVNFEMKCSRK